MALFQEERKPFLSPSGAEKREQIVQAAAALFREKGYHGTSIGDIAARVGLPKGGIYHYIDSKEQLLYEITCRGIRALLPLLRRIRDSHLAPEPKLREAVRAHIASLAAYRDYVSVFLQEKRALAPEHLKEYVRDRDDVEQIFRDIIREGIEKGCFREVNPKLIAFAILGMCNWVVQWYRVDGESSIEEIAELFADAAARILRP